MRMAINNSRRCPAGGKGVPPRKSSGTDGRLRNPHRYLPEGRCTEDGRWKMEGAWRCTEEVAESPLWIQRRTPRLCQDDGETKVDDDTPAFSSRDDEFSEKGRIGRSCRLTAPRTHSSPCSSDYSGTCRVVHRGASLLRLPRRPLDRMTMRR